MRFFSDQRYIVNKSTKSCYLTIQHDFKRQNDVYTIYDLKV